MKTLDFAPDMDNLFHSSTPLWEQMWEHRIFDALNVDDDGQVIDSPIDIDKSFGQKFKERPVENQFNVSEGDFWIPTEQVITTEYIKNDVLDRLNVDNQKQRRLDRFESFMKRVDKAASPAAIGYIGYQAYEAIQASTQAFEKDGRMHEAPTLFPAGYLKCFWKAYGLKKSQLLKASTSDLEEIEILLAKELTVQELKTLKKGIYSSKLNFKKKQVLWAECDKRIIAITA